MLHWCAFFMVLTSIQIWEQSFEPNLKTHESQNLERVVVWISLRMEYSLSENDRLSNDTLSKALRLDASEASKIAALRQKHDQKISELEKEKVAAHRIAKQWRDFFTSSRSLLDTDSTKRFEILTLKLALDRVRRLPLDFQYPVLLKEVSGLDFDESSLLLSDTRLATQRYHDKRQQLIASAMEEVLSCIPIKARTRFTELIGDQRTDLLKTRSPLVMESDTIENVKKSLMLGIVKHGDFISSLELVDEQKGQLEIVYDYLGSDPHYEALDEAALEYERAGLDVPEKLNLQVQKEKDRVVERALNAVKKILLPHQLSQLNSAAVQVYLREKHKSALPFEWPSLLTDELGLSSVDSEKLGSVTKAAVERFRIEEREVVTKLNEEVFAGVPKKMQQDLERLKSLTDFSLDELTPIPSAAFGG